VCSSDLPKPWRRPMRRAFTLIELLVVVAIISLLVSILLPSLAKAKALAKQAMCLSNLHGMGVAAQQYAAGNNDFFPKARVDTTGDPTYFSIEWDFRKRWDGTIEAGLLWGQGEDMRIQQCPSFEGSPSGGDPYTGYNYNTSYIGHGDGEKKADGTKNYEPAQVDDVKRPANCAIFGDGEGSSGTNKFMRAPLSHPDEECNYRYAGTQGFPHMGATSVAYCDGHAASQSERYTNISPSYHQSNIVEGTGFLSPDNSAYDLE